jgi:hypothetical protein
VRSGDGAFNGKSATPYPVGWLKWQQISPLPSICTVSGRTPPAAGGASPTPWRARFQIQGISRSMVLSERRMECGRGLDMRSSHLAKRGAGGAARSKWRSNTSGQCGDAAMRRGRWGVLPPHKSLRSTAVLLQVFVTRHEVVSHIVHQHRRDLPSLELWVIWSFYPVHDEKHRSG